MKEKYREGASAVVFRPVEAGYSVLLVHKPRKKDSWQLPQGGVEGEEDLRSAAMRELNEETGLNGDILGASARVYQYDFPPSYRRYRPDNVRGQRIRFIFVRVPASAIVRVDGQEIDAFAWISARELPRYISRKEYAELVRSLIMEGQELLAS